MDTKLDIRVGHIACVRLGLDHGSFTLWLEVEGPGWGCCYGGFIISNVRYMQDGHVHIGNPGALETLRQLMYRFGCEEDIQDLKGRMCFVKMCKEQYGGVRIQELSPVGLFDDDGNVVYSWFNWKDEFAKAKIEELRVWKEISDANH